MYSYLRVKVETIGGNIHVFHVLGDFEALKEKVTTGEQINTVDMYGIAESLIEFNPEYLTMISYTKVELAEPLKQVKNDYDVIKVEDDNGEVFTAYVEQ